VFKYDATECMISDINEGNINEGGKSLLFVIDTSDPKTFIAANDAYYLISEELKSPMSAGLSAFRDEKSAIDFKNKFGGKIYKWDQVMQVLQIHGRHN
ncbi:MAG: nitrous oxide reductase accessory protein NosL, partial [Romboutsia sp.]|nr:nitrous oxide reductase accessory protein NosL [Romboutsia sp.]